MPRGVRAFQKEWSEVTNIIAEVGIMLEQAIIDGDWKKVGKASDRLAEENLKLLQRVNE